MSEESQGNKLAVRKFIERNLLCIIAFTAALTVAIFRKGSIIASIAQVVFCVCIMIFYRKVIEELWNDKDASSLLKIIMLIYTIVFMLCEVGWTGEHIRAGLF